MRILMIYMKRQHKANPRSRFLRWQLLVLMVYSFTLISCIAEPSTKEIKEAAQKMYSAKMEEFLNEGSRNCEVQLEERANEIADSMLLNLAKQFSFDSFPKPPVLPKPGSPPVMVPFDTTPLAPLWSLVDSNTLLDSLLLDSLLRDSFLRDSMQFPDTNFIKE